MSAVAAKVVSTKNPRLFPAKTSSNGEWAYLGTILIAAVLILVGVGFIREGAKHIPLAVGRVSRCVNPQSNTQSFAAIHSHRVYDGDRQRDRDARVVQAIGAAVAQRR